MHQVEALSVQDVTKVGVIITIALVVIGVLLSIVITALIARVIILLVVAVLAIFVWQQRSHVKDEINAHKCNLHATYFGFHLDAPQSVIRACRKHT
jgi:protein-S-isoprenylcysteine O-methyltransferase Ste14